MYKKAIYLWIFISLVVFSLPVLSGLTLKKRVLTPPPPERTAYELHAESYEKDLEITYFDAEEKKLKKAYLESYLKGVIAAEMPSSYEKEALKAQAVAARSYIMFKDKNPSPAHPAAAVCTDPSHCKAYISEKQKSKEEQKKISEAVYETKGEYLSYNGETVEAFFFALSNGKTENSEDVWQSEVPYLKSTESAADINAPNFISTAAFDISDFNSRLRKLSKDFSPKTTAVASNIIRTQGGRVKSLKINGTTFSGGEIRSAFSLKSTDFSIEQSGSEIIFTTKGNGHGVGMSQYGANELAKNGKTYEEILKHYYTGVEIMNKQQ